ETSTESRPLTGAPGASGGRPATTARGPPAATRRHRRRQGRRSLATPGEVLDEGHAPADGGDGEGEPEDPQVGGVPPAGHRHRGGQPGTGASQGGADAGGGHAASCCGVSSGSLWPGFGQGCPAAMAATYVAAIS